MAPVYSPYAHFMTNELDPTDRSLNHRISEAVHKAQTRGQEPNSLYIGKAEQAELDQIVADLPKVTMSPEDQRRFPFTTYRGLRVYCVTEPSHLFVG